ncbi:MAG: glycosyltransferase family 4 protein, partial [Flavisolibacter sp.]|nr:glycosyltransferase family 4 protein [Flavisolibacter sp.]
GQRLKYEQYFTIFKEHGYEVTVSPFMSEPFQKIVYTKGNLLKKAFWTFAGYVKRVGDLFRLRKYDVVYVFLWVAPFAPPLFEKLTRKLAKKLVYDIDDLIFLNPLSSTNPLVHYLRSPRNHISLMKTADHVITCTPYLDQFVRKYNQKTTDISSTINTDIYKPKLDYSVKGKFTIGWSGSHSTSKYLHLLDDVFLELAKEQDFRLLVMGDATFSLPGVDVEALPWQEEYEVKVITRFDIGVYPLPDEEWVLGKSGLKALQYMALGIPTIATGIGTIHRIIKDGENGFLVSSKEEWKQRIRQLISDQELREKVGKKAAKTVEQHYSVNANKATYLSILDGLASN